MNRRRVTSEQPERVLERQRRVTLPPQRSGEDKAAVAQVERERSQRSPAGTRQRFTRPEPPIGPGQKLDAEPVAPRPVRTAPPDARGGLVAVAGVGALLLAVGAATTWRVRHRRPQPESTA